MRVPRFTTRKLLAITTGCALLAAFIGFFTQIVGWRNAGQSGIAVLLIVIAMLLTGWYRLRQDN